MKSRSVIELTAESYEEEQFLLNRFPRTAWIKLGEEVRFYIPNEKLTDVAKALTEWKLAENKKGK